MRSSTAPEKTLIGEYSSVLGVAAGVDGAHHDDALKQLLTELERVRQHGLTAQDLDRERSKIRLLADAMLAKDESRTFEQWVTSLNDAAVQNRPVVAPHQIAQRTLNALDTIDLAALNARLNRWLNSPTKCCNSPPGNRVVRLPKVDDVQQLRASIAHSSLAAPSATPVAPPAATFTLPLAGAPGSVLGKRSFTAEQVEHWQLSNGDRLVWLRRNAEKTANGDCKPNRPPVTSAATCPPGACKWRRNWATRVARQDWRRGVNSKRQP